MADDSEASDAEQEGSLLRDKTEATEGDSDKSQIALDDILKREDVLEEIERRAQSKKDKELGQLRRQMERNTQLRRESLRRTREEEELDSLLEAEDFETLGRKSAQQILERKQLEKAAAQVSAEIERLLLERPEFKVLGEDKISSLYSQTQEAGGNVADFVGNLAGALMEHTVALTLEKAQEGVLKEVEARLVEAGLAKRTEAKGASEPIERSTKSASQLTEDELLTAFGEGDESVDRKEITRILKSRGIDTPT